MWKAFSENWNVPLAPPQRSRRIPWGLFRNNREIGIAIFKHVVNHRPISDHKPRVSCRQMQFDLLLGRMNLCKHVAP
jgi:hypothetical protein